MEHNSKKLAIAGLLVTAGVLAACGGGGGGGGDSTSTSANTSSSSSSSSSSSGGTATTQGVTGWASYGTNNLGGTGTTGGEGATTAKTYTVSSRAGLIQALYGGSATINTDGSFSGTLDSSKKIIYISGTISLSQNAAGTELTADDYVTGSCAKTTYGYTTASAMWTDYEAAFNPQTLPPSSATQPSGTSESARACAAALQKKVVVLYVPSNTSIIGVGSSAKIQHGTLMLGTSSAAVDNIVIRNIGFEDAFDIFPAWDPTDSTTGRWNAAYDLISVQYATHVWIDHNEFSDGARPDDNFPSVWTGTASDGTNYATDETYKFMHHDGLVDTTKVGNYVTLSYNYFHDHDKSFLIGGTDSASLTAEHPGVLSVTYNNNYFKNLRQRQPRVRYGMVHVYNNYYENTVASSASYGWAVAWTSGQGSRLYVENNAVVLSGSPTASSLYVGSSSSSKVTSCAALSGMSSDYCSAYAYLTGNTLNGAAVDLSTVTTTGVTWSSTPWPTKSSPSSSTTSKPSDYYSYTATTAPTSAPTDVGVGKL